MSTETTLPPAMPAEAKSGGGVVLQRLVSLRAETESSIHYWTMYHNEGVRSANPRTVEIGREQICWLRGYLKALDDVGQANGRDQRPERE